MPISLVLLHDIYLLLFGPELYYYLFYASKWLKHIHYNYLWLYLKFVYYIFYCL